MNEHVRWHREFHALVGEADEPTPVRDRLEHEVATLRRQHAAGTPVATVPLRFGLSGLRDASVEDILARPVTEEEARAAIVGLYWFSDWDAVTASDAVIDPVFERAVDALVDGRVEELAAALSERPELVRQRSPYGHRATLLHYVSANGVETRRQTTPSRIVEATIAMIDAGAEVDATAGSYGEGANNTPLCLTVSSGHPAEAGLQGAIVEALLEGGAALEGKNDDGMPLATALAFGYTDTAELLVRHGARVRNLVVAAGLGRDDLVAELLRAPLEPYVDPYDRVVTDRGALLGRALVQAAKPALTAVSRLLLDAGADPDTTFENGRTALHWVAYAGNAELAELLLERGADPTVRDRYYDASPATWAREGGHAALADRLEAAANG